MTKIIAETVLMIAKKLFALKKIWKRLSNIMISIRWVYAYKNINFFVVRFKKKTRKASGCNDNSNLNYK